MSPLEEAEILNSVDEKRHRIGLSALSIPEQVLTLLSQARFKFELSGFNEFFVSPLTANLVNETIWVFEQIGAYELAQKLQCLANFYVDEDSDKKTHHSVEYEIQGNQFLDGLNSLDFYLSRYMETHKAELAYN